MKEDIAVFLKDIFEDFMQVLPRLILALLILFIGYLIARLIKKSVNRFILYLNEKMNQQLQINTLNVDLKTSARFISSAFFWILILLTLLICIRILKLEFLAAWFDQIIKYLPNILAAVIIVFIGVISGKLLSDLIQSAAIRTGIANGKFIGKLVKYLILFITIVIAVDQVGVDIAFLSNLFIVILASLLFGAALAFALGAQTSVGNILSSHYLRKSYQPGMKIQIGDIKGTIVKISDHSIAIETKSGLMNIPAKDFSESRVIILKDQLK
ncbi:mechanosensitive ion channel family protein [Ekhidna sp.]|uniref:mechanosensitive ion channel family protein n=1 Tax=Ekhidna sp. TaxID=2608089 RepID=UPI003B504022